MKKDLNEEESLALIGEMIANSKSRLGESSFFYLLWGWLVLVASLTNFILLSANYRYAFLPWPVMMFTGGIVAGIAGRRMKAKTRVKTYFDTAMQYIWLSFAITLGFVLFSAGLGKISWEMSNIFIIALYGMGTFVSGSIIRFKPLKAGGIASWIIAGLSLFIMPEYTYLSIALSIVIAYLIPGYMLRKKEKEQNHV